jgi:hypothetical protein
MRYPHIVFLDFDGPLYSNKAMLLPENNGGASEILRELKLHPFISYWKADPMAIAMLHYLHNLRPFQLVISSSWADERMNDKEQIERVLRINDLDIPMHKDWRTPRIKGVTERAGEIAEWLKNNKYSDYMVIDDDESGPQLANQSHIKNLELDKYKIVLVDVDEGLTMNNFYQMQAIVRNWD